MTRFHYASTKDSDMLYLVQHQITDPFFFLETDGRQYIFLSSTDIEAFKEESHGSVEAVDVGPLQSEAVQQSDGVLGNLAKIILEKYEVSGEVTVPATFPISIADTLRANSLQLTVGINWCPERERKSPVEILKIKENSEHTKKAFQLIEQILTDSKIEGLAIMYDSKPLTSEFLKREVSKLLLDYDLENPTGLIISCGKHAAMPHHMGTGPILPNQTIVVDIFPQSTTNHYFADMTRTYVKGEPSPDIKNMYEAVQEAQQKSLVALKPGVTGREAFEISAEVIRRRGFDVGEKGYIHSLGHGLGVDVHEAPSLSAGSGRCTEVRARRDG